MTTAVPATDFTLSPNNFAKRLLAWFDVHGRHDLPWQHNTTPYRVWVSEIMLQQTQVSTVIPYYQRFMDKFSTVEQLANAKQDEVLSLWTGLGYYARARNLHKAAQQIVLQYQGEFPQTIDELTQLAGIGRSTAAAILSISQNLPEAILDGNVKRVLARLYAIEQPPSAARDKQMWALAEQLTPNYRNADYTQAIMDLGATLCKRGQPNCDACPFNDACLAYKKGIAKSLPVGKKPKPLPIKSTFILLLQNPQGEVLLEQRPPSGLWGGLWCPLEVDQLNELPKLLTQKQLITRSQTTLNTFRHTFSHFHLDITPVLVRVEFAQAVSDSNQQWVSYNNSKNLGLAAPIKKLLKALNTHKK